MPIYTFENGKDSIELLAPIGTEVVRHEGRQWRRTPIARCAAIGFARKPEMRDEVKRGFKKLEDADGSRFRSIFTKNQIRKIWDI